MISIGEFVALRQPAVYGALVTWPGEEYRAARRLIMESMSFKAWKRMMETPYYKEKRAAG